MTSPGPVRADLVFEPGPTAADAIALQAAMASTARPVIPPPSVRTMLLARAMPVDRLPQHFRIDAGPWRPTQMPGIRQRVLEIDNSHGRATLMLRLEAEARLPHHPHSGVEEFLILHGDLVTSTGDVLSPGHYERSQPGSTHEEQWSRTGCVALLVLPLDMLQGIEVD